VPARPLLRQAEAVAYVESFGFPCNSSVLISDPSLQPPLLYLPANAVDEGNVNIVVNKKTITSHQYSYQAIGYVPSSDDPYLAPPIALPLLYTYFVSTTTPNVLDRVSYTLKLNSGVESTVTFDFWQRGAMSYSSVIVPDTSCRKDCFDLTTTFVSVRAQPTSFYPPGCTQPVQEGCYCVNNTISGSGFCHIPWPISSEIDFDATLSYAIHMKNLTVDGQVTAIPSECSAEMTDFICRFYFPPCDPVGARMRPPINGTLNCFRENPLYFNLDGTLTTLATAHLGKFQARMTSSAASEYHSATEQPIVEPTIALQPHTSSPIDLVPPPTHEAPQPSVEPPSHPVEPSAAPLAPVAIPIMTSASIDYAISFAVFSSYDVAAKKTVTYPDINTLKNWQIALMLFGSIALILTIIISIIMANRKVVSHYQKISA